MFYLGENVFEVEDYFQVLKVPAEIWGGGPLPSPQGVRRDMYRKNMLGVGDHFQALKVSERHVPGNIFAGGGPLPGP